MSTKISPFSLDENLKIIGTETVNMSNTTGTITEDTYIGYQGSSDLHDGWIIHTVNSDYNSVRLYPTRRNYYGQHENEKNHNDVNEFLITTNTPCLLYLPEDFIKVTINWSYAGTFSFTPINATENIKILEIAIVPDGVVTSDTTYNSYWSMVGSNIESWPPKVYQAIKGSADLSFDIQEQAQHCYKGLYGDHDWSVDSNSNFYMGQYSSSSVNASALGVLFPYSAIGTKTIPNPIYFTKSLLLRIGVFLDHKTPVNSSGTRISSHTFTVNEVSMNLKGKKILLDKS